MQKRCSYIVLQYDLDGNFIKEWSSASECGRNGFSQTMISNVCRQEQYTAHGFLWKYKYDDRNIKEWVIKANNKKSSGKPKKIGQQFDLNNNLIMEYPSGADAARALNKKDKSNICRAARTESKAYGYYWKYKN